MASLGSAGELAAVPMSRLEAVCKEQDAKWLHRLSLGIDDEEVLNLLPRSFALSCLHTQMREVFNGFISTCSDVQTSHRVWQVCRVQQPA